MDAAGPRITTRLDELMRERGLTGKELAAQANVAPRLITGLRRNSLRLLDAYGIGRICRALQITPAELFTINDG